MILDSKSAPKGVNVMSRQSRSVDKRDRSDRFP